MPHRDERKTKPAEERGSSKKPYSPPKLTSYSKLKEITKYLSGEVTDGYSGSSPFGIL